MNIFMNNWQERFSSKMNRSSWKTAHYDAHPQIEDMDDMQSHLMHHHSGDFLGDIDDHEWYHLDPYAYNDFHNEHGWPIENNQPDHYHTNDYEKSEIPDSLPKSFASFNKLADPTDTLRGEGISGMIDPDEEVVGPQDLDSNATKVDKFPKSVGVFKNAAGGSEFGNPIDYNENRMQSLEAPGLEIKTPLDTGKRNYSEQRQDANPLTLRSWFTGDDVNGPWPHTKNLSGPLDFEPTDNQNEDSTGPVMSSFQSRYSHFDDVVHPFPTEDNIYDHLKTHHFGENPIGDDYLMQSLREKLPLTNNELLGEHSTFHYDDVRNKNPLVGESSMVHHHEHGDNPKVDVPDDLSRLTRSSSFQARYAHMEGVNHPWPEHDTEAKEHIISHHESVIQATMGHMGVDRDEAIACIRSAGIFRSRRVREKFNPIDAHIHLHKNPDVRAESPPTHEHDDDNLGIDIPENIETIAPSYVTTSSWHQSNVEVLDTNPDEETPDTLLNPADELKNGRPRSTDLPSQNAQFIPGMLVDHDPMGGSNFGST
jgi:hypothetical protein